MSSNDGPLRRIEERRASIAVIGIGYVGLPLLRAFWESGFSVLGCDTDPCRIAQLQAGLSHIHDVPDAAVAEMLASGRFEARLDLARLAQADAILICVPTPLTAAGAPDISFLTEAARSIRPHMKPGCLIILESTSYPGTTDEVLRPILEETGLKSGRDFFLAHAPERCDPGNASFNLGNTPKVVGAEGPVAQGLAEALYRSISPRVVPVRDAATAEAVKLTENVFRAVNIALVNELKLIFEGMGINIWEVMAAAQTKPFGFMPFYPGPGPGGHCIPIDPCYLTWKARELGLDSRLISLASQINHTMPEHVAERLRRALRERASRDLAGARILLLGVAYKKNVADTRESPGLRLIGLLEAGGAVVDYHDPLVLALPLTGDDATRPDATRPDATGPHATEPWRRSVDITGGAVAGYDAVLIVTDHDAVDYAAVVSAARLVVDTRNVTKDLSSGRDKIIHA